MDNEKLNKENSSIDTQDYISEISDKKNILSTLLDKFKEQKEKKERKLLSSPDPKKTQVTNRSIFSLWGVGNLRAALFDSFDTVRKFISEKFSQELPKNTLATEIISEDYLSQKAAEQSKDTNLQETHISPIIPEVKTKPKNIINNAKTAKDEKIEVATIDTSAIKKETEISKEAKEPTAQKQEKTQSIQSENIVLSSNQASSQQNNIEEHEL